MNEAEKLTTPFARVIDWSNDLADAQQMTGRYFSDIPVDVSRATAENPQFSHWLNSNWVETTENGLASFTSAEMATMASFIQEIRSSNTSLLERVVQLEQELNECQNGLQSQTARSQVAQSRLIQQNKELSTTTEQVESLSDQLETANQTIQSQKILNENLTIQLASSQERIAQIERECSVRQANYNEKLHQLIQTENSCRELRARLVRQQRYTMQLKVALEKCMEEPVASLQSPSDGDSGTTSGHVLPKAQPITAWAEPTVGSQWTSNNEKLTTENCKPPTIFNSIPSRASIESLDNPLSTEQCFFFTEDIDAAQEANLEDLFNLLEAEAEREAANNEVAPALDIDSLAHLEPQLAQSDLSKSSPEIPFQPLESTQPITKTSNVNPNWPSPLVYPLHPPKKRKSLSAIELPTFTQKK